MIGLIASLFALGIGPLIYQTFGPLKRTDKIVSGFILVVIVGTILVEILPELVSTIGYLAIVLATLGFIGPTLLEKFFVKSASRTHQFTILLGILGLILHAAIDGAALYAVDGTNQHEKLSLAIILHRLPVGLTIWWLLKPLLGERYALLTLIAMAIATCGGYFLSMYINQIYSSYSMIAIQSFISGSLLHVVIHKHHDDGCPHTGHTHAHTEEKIDTNWFVEKLPSKWESIGMLIGIMTLILIELIA